MSVEFAIEDHPEFSGYTLNWIGTFSDHSSERTVESLQIAGWQGDDVAELAGVPASSVLADQVSLDCDVDSYTDGEGNTRENLRVQWVNRLGGRFQFKQEADPAALRALGARLRSTAQSLRAGGGQRGARQAGAPSRQTTQRSGGSSGGGYGGSRHPNAPGGPDDDIPFASSLIEHEPNPIAAVLRRS
ncbi:MAG TPA: hypothetical protein VFQ42_22035 [Mycobacterium sp.]|nr:hypothetical protein [Mycobacterium sp.]